MGNFATGRRTHLLGGVYSKSKRKSLGGEIWRLKTDSGAGFEAAFLGMARKMSFAL